MIACDIALIPPDDITDLAIRINKSIGAAGGNGIALNKTDCLPHITLAMGLIDEENIPKIKVILINLSSIALPMELEISPDPDKKHYLGITCSAMIKGLHEAVVESLGQFFKGPADKRMFHDPEGCGISDSSVSYVSGFAEKSSYANFEPHITVQSSDIPIEPVSERFAARKLVLAQLGNHCTVRRIL
jgi:2'-5' RNA ligase